MNNDTNTKEKNDKHAAKQRKLGRKPRTLCLTDEEIFEVNELIKYLRDIENQR